MSAFKNATEFFHACESGKGWEACKGFAEPNAGFDSQAFALTDIQTLEDYTHWMQGITNGPMAGSHYELTTSAFDHEKNTAIFFGTFFGIHSGEGGPVAATGKKCASHYVYVMQLSDEGKVTHMTKIWNDGWALKELGWTDTQTT
ncbi:hypothetical protein K6Q96_19195 [Grimontia kaedaensis]|uniref:Polyketide cyclase n=1 Tax=Grimontia kaedaensis TaxID=2872157 RepID=A0ABY4X2C0_9GAMM|nr:hypothetical protein [Grimontia kaedaensis]USH05337.1 hypothetical protein K6Q96_19195 [Grimontia kaedaensis]